jgi:hypothetical protein
MCSISSKLLGTLKASLSRNQNCTALSSHLESLCKLHVSFVLRAMFDMTRLFEVSLASDGRLPPSPTTCTKILMVRQCSAC